MLKTDEDVSLQSLKILQMYVLLPFDVLILCTSTSRRGFSILLLVYFLRHWEGEFVFQS